MPIRPRRRSKRSPTAIASRHARWSFGSALATAASGCMRPRSSGCLRSGPAGLRAAALRVIELQRAIVAQNVTTPGGAVDTGPQRLTFRVSGRVPTVTALGEIIVRAVEGAHITLADVGTVRAGEGEGDTV